MRSRPGLIYTIMIESMIVAGPAGYDRSSVDAPDKPRQRAHTAAKARIERTDYREVMRL